MVDFITGEKFMELGKFTYSPPSRSNGDYNRLRNTLQPSLIKDMDIIYTHTLYINQLFNLIGSDKRHFIVVSHNSDTNIDESFKLPPNIVKWYSQNVCVKNERIESIPIGLENNRWFPEIRKKEKMMLKLQTSNGVRNWLYMNHNIKTNEKERTAPYIIFKDQPWITIENGKNGYDFDKYLDNIYHHRFVICPRGNGVDTHRTWETLYMGSIPIEKKNINNQFYTDLPICFVNYWEEVTEEFLEIEYARIKGKQWKMEMLDFGYWKNKINGYA
jgi:hypothetical protein